ncbi:MAG: hypothetical protein ACRDKI_04020 [Solirubrobacterales bacterium]
MSMIKRIGASRVAIATMAAILAASGAAFAAGGGGEGGPSGQGGQGGQQRGPGGPGGGPKANRYLTYVEVHSYKRGKETVLRTDAGKITEVSSTSITVHERDGNDVTRALDEDTDIHIRGNSDATAADLSVGDSVIVSGEKDQPADDVGVRK